MVRIVELGNSCTQRFDTCRGAIFTSGQRDVDLLGAFEATFDIVVYLRRTLAEIGPVSRVILKAMLVGTFGTPHDAGRGSGGVQSCMSPMAFMCIAKLAVDLAVFFAGIVGSISLQLRTSTLLDTCMDCCPG